MSDGLETKQMLGIIGFILVSIVVLWDYGIARRLPTLIFLMLITLVIFFRSNR